MLGAKAKKMKRVLTLLLLITVLAGCQVLGGGGDDDNDDENTNTTSQNSDAVIQWDDDPENVVFRAEVTGGELINTLAGQNEVPLCTIYGDNRVVWTVNADGSSSPQVLFARVDDFPISNFIELITFYYRIYEYDADADLVPLEDGAVPAVEQITVNVNDLTHVTDAFSGWDFQFFEEILSQCRALSTAPTVFEPTEAWISAELVEFDTNRPSISLPESVIDLADIANASEPTWIEGDSVRILWSQLRSTQPDVQFEQGENTYQLGLQVPSVTIDSPPAP